MNGESIKTREYLIFWSQSKRAREENGSRKKYFLDNYAIVYDNQMYKYVFICNICVILFYWYSMIDSQTCSYMWDPIFESNSDDLPTMCPGRWTFFFFQSISHSNLFDSGHS
jgi:hypothetical protein